ncbi:hypothetical protein EBZ39_02965 [bacterium]|nr:hypothetical protein [bacterium]
MGATVKIKTDSFARQLERMAGQSRRSFSVVLNEQVKNFVKEVIAVTPPGKPGGVGNPKTRGTRNVRTDILKVMRGTTVQKRVQETDIAGAHRKARTKRGRTREQKPRIVVPADALRSYIRMKQANVGKLAAGWNATARKFGYTPPAWIARHRGKGAVLATSTRSKIRVRATNATPYASDQHGLERRIQVGLYIQANKMKRRVDSAIVDAAKRAALKAR